MREEAVSCPWCPEAIRSWRQGQLRDRTRGPAEARSGAQTGNSPAEVGSGLPTPAAPDRDAGASTVVEILEFARRRGYRKIGIATCGDFGDAAQAACRALERDGFEVILIGRSDPVEEEPWLPEFRDPRPTEPGMRCNPIAQAKLLNAEGCDFNLAVGLCVGCDSLFFRHAEPPTTVLQLGGRALDQYLARPRNLAQR